MRQFVARVRSGGGKVRTEMSLRAGKGANASPRGANPSVRGVSNNPGGLMQLAEIDPEIRVIENLTRSQRGQRKLPGVF
ncbi:MAG TPA: hypothetical protein VFS20_20000 [Longimicrobium sp.]|nr:hypothetical protein [Longimicrobium sp.]